MSPTFKTWYIRIQRTIPFFHLSMKIQSCNNYDIRNREFFLNGDNLEMVSAWVYPEKKAEIKD